MKLKTIHDYVACISFLFILSTCVTGVIYGVLKEMFSMKVKILMKIHTMSLIGLSAYFPLFMGLSLIFLATSGAIFSFLRIFKDWSKLYKNLFSSFRNTHKQISLVSFIPILLVAITGFLHRLLRKWLHFPKEPCRILLQLHSFSILGPQVGSVTLFFVGTLIVLMTFSGIQMTTLWRYLKKAPQFFFSRKWKM